LYRCGGGRDNLGIDVKERQHTGNADDEGEDEAWLRTVEEVPENGVGERETERDLEGRLPGQFALYTRIMVRSLEP
jgi:hypothetical protein